MEILTSLDILKKLEAESRQVPEDPRFVYDKNGEKTGYSRLGRFKTALANFISGGYLEDVEKSHKSLALSIWKWRDFVKGGGGYGTEIADQITSSPKVKKLV
jgi:hypothetical protein